MYYIASLRNIIKIITFLTLTSKYHLYILDISLKTSQHHPHRYTSITTIITTFASNNSYIRDAWTCVWVIELSFLFADTFVESALAEVPPVRIWIAQPRRNASYITPTQSSYISDKYSSHGHKIAKICLLANADAGVSHLCLVFFTFPGHVPVGLGSLL